MNTNTLTQQYEIYACLPFVALEGQKSIKFGPLIFWPASKYREFVSSEQQQVFSDYMGTISHIKARIAQKQASIPSFIETNKLDLEQAVCISIESTIPIENRKPLLIDALHLLYFAITYQNLYFNREVISFNAFRKLIPADMPFIKFSDNWENLFIQENCREETVFLPQPPAEIIEGFGQLLYMLYDPTKQLTEEKKGTFERITRAICYLVDRFYPRFINIVEKGLTFPNNLYEMEDIVFLAASFEALLDVDESQRSADFKHKVRPLLHMRYAKPLELFWKWVDDFYDIRKHILKGGVIDDALFKINSNFEIAHLLIGLKIFIYIIFGIMFQNQLIRKNPDEFGLSVDEILIFFWTEESLIKKIDRYLVQLNGEPNNQELIEEIKYLAQLYLLIAEKGVNGIRYIPTVRKDIEAEISNILQHASYLPDQFVSKIIPKEVH